MFKSIDIWPIGVSTMKICLLCSFLSTPIAWGLQKILPQIKPMCFFLIKIQSWSKPMALTHTLNWPTSLLISLLPARIEEAFFSSRIEVFFSTMSAFYQTLKVGCLSSKNKILNLPCMFELCIRVCWEN